MFRKRDSFFSSAAWTGKPAPFASPSTPERAAPAQAEVAVLEHEPLTVEPAPPPYVPLRYDAVKAEVPTFDRAALAEYIAVAAEVGVAPADLHVEEFKAYLIDSGMTVFSLATVVQFMDAKSKAEGRGWGWNWIPLREKDRVQLYFGTEATRREPTMNWGDTGPKWIGEDRPASDHYSPYRNMGRMGGASATPSYDKVVPLHALKKVAQIEKAFPHKVAFMVSDYAPAPAFKADPFLMAVVPNAGVAGGAGRFVIDVWDEPGFGIEMMLQSDL